MNFREKLVEFSNCYMHELKTVGVVLEEVSSTTRVNSKGDEQAVFLVTVLYAVNRL